MFEVTRKEITEAAARCLGWRFRHQARGEANSVDCVGLLVVIGRALGYPQIFDVEGYRRVPSADTIRQTLRQNCDEISVEDVKEGDIYLMRMGGLKPRHTAIYYASWPEPMIIHASAQGVRLEPLSNFPASWFVAGFRLRGLID